MLNRVETDCGRQIKIDEERAGRPSAVKRRLIDARPSDALAMALGHSVPIFVAESVVAQAAINKDDVMPSSPSSQPNASPLSI